MEQASFLVLYIVFTLLLRPVAGIPLGSFYSFGTVTGDGSLGPSDDGSSSGITLNEPFPFFNEDHPTLFVSSSHHNL